jgi:hypothetical protein
MEVGRRTVIQCQDFVNTVVNVLGSLKFSVIRKIEVFQESRTES